MLQSGSVARSASGFDYDLIAYNKSSDAIEYFLTVRYVYASGLKDRGMAGYAMAGVDNVFGSKGGVMGIEQRQSRRVVQLRIGHHLIHVGLRDALLRIIDARGYGAAPCPVCQPERRKGRTA